MENALMLRIQRNAFSEPIPMIMARTNHGAYVSNRSSNEPESYPLPYKQHRQIPRYLLELSIQHHEYHGSKEK